MRGACNRDACSLVHADQHEYLGSQEYIDDGYPWRKQRPKIEEGFLKDLEPYKKKQL